MGGPIVRTGTTPEFWKNWDNIFGAKSASKKKTGKSPTKSAAKSAKPAKAAKPAKSAKKKKK